jgi:hypothetical protein
MIRKTALLLAALLLIAQSNAVAQNSAEDEGDYEIESYVDFYVFGDGTVWINLLDEDFGDAAQKTIRARLPEVLGCRWHTREKLERGIAGTCSRWLKSERGQTTAPLDLAKLAQFLRNNGAQRLQFRVGTPWGGEFPLQKGWVRGDRGRLVFTSASAQAVPPKLWVPVSSTSPGADRILVPILLVLFVPGLVAYYIRLRTINAPATKKLNWLVWLQWINLVSWLYWINSLNPSDLIQMLNLAGMDNPVISVLAATTILATPPLLSIAATITAMAPLMSSSDESFGIFFKRRLVVCP